MAYGIRNVTSGVVTYFDADDHTVVNVPVALCPEDVAVSTKDSGTDIPNDSTNWVLPVAQFRTMVVSNEGSDSVVVNTPDGAVTIHVQGSRKFGNGVDLMNSADFQIDTGANSDADVLWRV